MSKKPELKDLPGLGPKIEEKLREAGIKTILSLSRANADKLAEKVDGLSVSRAQTLIAAAQESLQSAPAKEVKPKKAEAKEEVPKKKAAVKKEPKEKAEAKKEAPKKTTAKKVSEKKGEVTTERPKPSKKPKTTKLKPKVRAVKKEKHEVPLRFKNVDQRLVRIARNKKMRMPPFQHENAHRWTRVARRWRQVRGIDSYTRQKKHGRIAMVRSGYRTPKATRNLHPSMFIEVPVSRPSDLESLNPDIHAVRITGTVGGRKRQEILSAADAKLLRVLNPGTTEEIGEEELFTDLDLEEEKS